MSDLTRRTFMLHGAATAAGALGAAALGEARADDEPAPGGSAPIDELRVGVIGCGGRGSGAALNALHADPSVRIVALADLFGDRLETARRNLSEHGGSRGEVSPERCFAGFDAYRQLLDVDLDIVILATPPGFRPAHFQAVIERGRHAFIEKPVAVCPAGVRQVRAAAELADRRDLKVLAGTQRRHEQSYRQAIDRLRGGVIGEPVAARCFWNMGGLWSVPPQESRSDVENQIRNWLYHTWLSGDHIVEQHVHNIDVVNWVFDAWPVRACAVGGRQARTTPEFGHIYDHFAVDFEYPGERFALSMARQQEGTTGRVEEIIHGPDGVIRLAPGMAEARGRRAWRFQGEARNPYLESWVDFIAAIRSGSPMNEGETVALSTLAAIMGRIAAYTGRDLSWQEALDHPLDLRPPEDLAFTAREQDPIAVPGRPPRRAKG